MADIVVGSTGSRIAESKAQKVILDVRLEQLDRRAQGWKLSICGEVWNNRGSDIDMGGQCVDKLCGEIKTWAPGWNRKRLARVVAIWERWHLNDMHAECEHQRARGETWVTHLSSTCPDCGYSLGSAWLFEEISSDVLAEVRELIATH